MVPKNQERRDFSQWADDQFRETRKKKDNSENLKKGILLHLCRHRQEMKRRSHVEEASFSSSSSWPALVL